MTATIRRRIVNRLARVSPQAQARVYLVSIFSLRCQRSLLWSVHTRESLGTRTATEIVSKPRARNRSGDGKL